MLLCVCVSLHHNRRFRRLHLYSLLIPGLPLLLFVQAVLTISYFNGHRSTQDFDFLKKEKYQPRSCCVLESLYTCSIFFYSFPFEINQSGSFSLFTVHLLFSSCSHLKMGTLRTQVMSVLLLKSQYLVQRLACGQY